MNLVVSAAALVLVLVLAWLVIKTLARFSPQAKRNGKIKLIETLPMGTRDRLVIIQYRNQEYLLGISNQGVQLIDKQVDVSPSEKKRNEPQG